MSGHDEDRTRVAAEGAPAALPLTRRALLGGASAGVIAAGTLPAWLAGCVRPEQQPWSDGTYWSDGTGWIDERSWPFG